MITEAIWDALCTFLGWAFDRIPTFTPPAWVETVNTYAVQGATTAAGFHNWVPLEAMRNGFAFVLSCSVIVLAVRGFRIVLSLFTGGGGGAA